MPLTLSDPPELLKVITTGDIAYIDDYFRYIINTKPITEIKQYLLAIDSTGNNCLHIAAMQANMHIVNQIMCFIVRIFAFDAAKTLKNLAIHYNNVHLMNPLLQPHRPHCFMYPDHPINNLFKQLILHPHHIVARITARKNAQAPYDKFFRKGIFFFAHPSRETPTVENAAPLNNPESLLPANLFPKDEPEEKENRMVLHKL